jgi:3-dehydroquinate dehydratase-1
MKIVKFGNLSIGNKPVLLCTVLEEDLESSIKSANIAIENRADCLELRIDKLKNKSMIKDVIQKINFPKLVVCRPKDWDGFFEGSEEERIEWLLEALDYNPEAIDIELKTEDSLRRKVIEKAKKYNIPVLIVYENFKSTPSKQELLGILEKEIELGADIAKFAVLANSYEDLVTVLDTINEAKRTINVPFVAIAMGKYGSISRALGPIMGTAMTYCASRKGLEGAPGQLPVKETRDIINILS